MTARRVATSPSRPPAGFSLVEMIVVVAIMGIIAAIVAVFIRAPVEGYVGASRRAVLTDAADTALRRMARDLRSALPNSIRVANVAGVFYLEFIPTVGGARYRQFPTTAGGGNVLDFNGADGAFDVIGPVPVYAAGNSLVVTNLGFGAADAYAGGNRSALASANAVAGLFSTEAAPHTVSFAALQLPLPSPGARFHVVTAPVSYECNPGTGELRRYWNYGFAAGQATPPVGATTALLASRVGECTIAYDPAANARTATITVWLRLTEAGESVRLVHQVHVVNVP